MSDAVQKQKKETLEDKIASVVDKKLDGYMEKITSMLEKKYPDEQKNGTTPGLQILGPVVMKNIYKEFAKPYIEAEPEKQFRFVFAHQEVLPQRRMYGWEPVKDTNGNEVRFGDQVLASMPKRRYQTEIVSRREAKVEHKRRANAQAVETQIEDLRKDMKNPGRYAVNYDVKYEDKPIEEGEKKSE